jgi:hypothetical protein
VKNKQMNLTVEALNMYDLFPMCLESLAFSAFGATVEKV